MEALITTGFSRESIQVAIAMCDGNVEEATLLLMQQRDAVTPAKVSQQQQAICRHSLQGVGAHPNHLFEVFYGNLIATSHLINMFNMCCVYYSRCHVLVSRFCLWGAVFTC